MLGYAQSVTMLRIPSHLRFIAVRPGFSLAVIVTIALATGAATTIFSLLQATLFKPLSYREPNHLVHIFESSPVGSKFVWGKETEYIVVRPGTLHEWREQSKAFEGIEAYRNSRQVLRFRDQSLPLKVSEVTAGFFPLCGVAPLLGRTLGTGDFSSLISGAVISERLWRQHYGSQRDLSGLSLDLNGRHIPVVGVMPSDFFPQRGLPTEIWLPYLSKAGDSSNRVEWQFRTLARLRPDFTIAAAQTELDGISERLRTAYPNDYAAMDAVVVPVLGELTNSHQKILFLFAIAGLLVAGVAAVNVANLLLSRTVERQSELAVRAALGAPAVSLFLEPMKEALSLSILGGALGFLFANLLLPLALRLQPATQSLPRQELLEIDGAAFVFSFFCSLFFALICALPGGIASLKDRVNSTLRDSGRGSGPSRRQRRFGDILVVAEISLSMMLLAGAGLLLRNLLLLEQTSSGMETQQVLSLRLTPPQDRYAPPRADGSGPELSALYRRLELEFAATPGVKHVSISDELPFDHSPNPWSISIEGRGAESEVRGDGTALSRKAGLFHHGSISIERVTPGFFATTGTKLTSGRFLDERDTAGRDSVVVVNQTFVNKFFPNENPIGRRITVDMTSYFPKFTIAGVVADSKIFGLNAPPYPVLYWSMAQYPSSGAYLMIRGKELGLSHERLRQAIARVDAGIGISEPGTLDQALANSIWQERAAAVILSFMGALALFLAMAGVFAVLSYIVERRMNELALRLTLGAQPAGVCGLVLGHAARLALMGVLIGSGLFWAMQSYAAASFIGFVSADAWMLPLVGSVLFILCLTACLGPALRALQADPATVLRQI